MAQEVVATQVLMKEQKYDPLAASLQQASKPSCCSQAIQALYCRRRRAMEVEVRTAVCCDHHAERRSRCRRPVVVIVVVERKLMDLAVGSSRLEVQK